MRTQSISKWLFGAAAAGALVAQSAPAHAEGGVALNRFNPSPAGDRMFGVPSPYAAGHLDLHAMVLLDYALNPLVLRRESTGENLGAVVSDQLFVRLNGTFALWNRLAINVDVPFAIAQSGDSPQPAGASLFASPSGAQLGDLRLGARLRLIGSYFDMFQLAIGGYVWLPTADGDKGSYVGEGAVRGMPQLIVGGRGDRVVWSGMIGADLRPSQSYGDPQGLVEQGTMFSSGLGLGFLLGEQRRFQIGPEVAISTVLSDPNSRNTNAEALAGARYRFADNWEASAAVGPGLTSGIGTPTLRVIASLAYTPEQKKPIPDRDKDTILDEVDACPDDPGVANADATKHGCPDRDKDTIIDKLDACPDVPGVASADAKKHGCPPDRDGDTILDAVDACPDDPGISNADATKHGCPDRDKDTIIDKLDACPDVAGVASDDAKKHGCPPDKDGDGVYDAQDACVDIPGLKTNDAATNGCPGDTDGDTVRDDKDCCPNEKGKPDPDPFKNGCPELVRVIAGEIVISQQVQFDTSKATIKKVSDGLLDQVSDVIKEHPEIIMIEVQGHTDSRGTVKGNEKLSQARADSVVAALVRRGVNASILSGKGYGQSVPIGDNGTDQGRQMNRRVQFKIVEKKAVEAPKLPAREHCEKPPAPAVQAPAAPAAKPKTTK